MRTDTCDILLFEILPKFHLVVGLKSGESGTEWWGHIISTLELSSGDHKDNNGRFCFPYGGFILCWYWLWHGAYVNSAITSFK